jgi:hypothetical protein
MCFISNIKFPVPARACTLHCMSGVHSERVRERVDSLQSAAGEHDLERDAAEEIGKSPKSLTLLARPCACAVSQPAASHLAAQQHKKISTQCAIRRLMCVVLCIVHSRVLVL